MNSFPITRLRVGLVFGGETCGLVTRRVKAEPRTIPHVAVNDFAAESAADWFQANAPGTGV